LFFATALFAVIGMIVLTSTAYTQAPQAGGGGQGGRGGGQRGAVVVRPRGVVDHIGARGHGRPLWGSEVEAERRTAGAEYEFTMDFPTVP